MNLGDRMKTIKITPRGYCHGVVSAINTITKLDKLSMKKPIYILGMLVHNKQIIEKLEQDGIITLHDPSKTRLEFLTQVTSGTVIFTAHGISPIVKQTALEKGLDIIDTTCDDVLKSQEVILEYLAQDYDVLYIGKHGHPESEAALSLSERVHLVETMDDLNNVAFNRIAITNQTTMSIYDVYQISEEAKKRFPNVVFVDEICNATRIRQEAIINQTPVDHCFIVGDILSNNSQKLVHVSIEEAHIPASLIETVDDIDIDFLKTLNCVSVSSGASTPTQTTNQVIQFLEQFDPLDISTHQR